MKKKRLSIALSFIIMAIAVTFGCLTAFADSHIHDMNITVVEATCTKQGYTYYECKGCDFKFKSDFTPINESNHNYVVTNQKKATCNQDGYTGDTVCEYCGNVVSSNTVVPQVSSIKLSRTTINYTGSVQRPTVTVTDSKGNQLTYKKDFTVSYSNWNSTNVGEYTVTVDLIGNYSGSLSKTFTIVPKSTTILKATPTYKAFTVQWNTQKTQTNGYQIQYSINSNFSGAKTITMGKNTYYAKKITGLSANKKYYVRVRTYRTVNNKNYYSSWSKATTITTTNYPTNITLSATTYTYDGKVKKPTVTVKNVNGNKVNSKYYSVSYSSGRKNVGTYKVTIKFKSPYSGSVTKTFNIKPKGTTIKSVSSTTNSVKCVINYQKSGTTGYRVQCSTDKTFSTNVKNLAIKSTNNTVTFSSLTPCQTYYVRVITYKTVGKTNYYAPKWSSVVSINTKTPNTPTTPSNLTAKVSKNTISVSWKASKYTTGYQIQWATKSNFSDYKSTTISGSSNISKTLSGLSYNKKYYIRVRSYHKVGSKNYYSSWISGSATTEKQNVTYVHYLNKDYDITQETKYSWQCSYNGYIQNNTYWYSSDQINLMKSECISIGNSIKSKLPANADVYEKIYLIQDWLENNIIYDLEYNTGRKYPNNTDIYNAYKYRRTTCGGYAYMFNDLCKYLGITAYYVTGDTPAGYHAWNIFVVEGYVYQIEPQCITSILTDNSWILENQYNSYYNYYKTPASYIECVNNNADLHSCQNIRYHLFAIRSKYDPSQGNWKIWCDNPDLWKVDKKLNDAAKSAANKFNKNEVNFYYRESATSAENFYDKKHYLDNEMVEYEIQTFELGFTFAPSDFLNEDGTFNHEKAEKFLFYSKQWIDKGYHFNYKSKKCYYFSNDSDPTYQIFLDVAQL